MAYCTADEVNLGSMDLPRGADVQSVIDVQAGYIDLVLGQRYRLPLVLSRNEPQELPYILLLNKMNVYAAKGTILLDAAGARQDENLSAWARYYLRYVETTLNQIRDGKIDIPNQEPARESADDGSMSPMIINKDTFSRVEAFYAVDQPLAPWQGTREEKAPWVL